MGRIVLLEARPIDLMKVSGLHTRDLLITGNMTREKIKEFDQIG